MDIDKELRKKCMDIYVKHKKTIDLINENLDIRYYTRNIIIKYLERKEEINFLEKHSSNNLLRFTTETLEKNFPEKDKNKKPYNFYEIWISKDKITVAFICIYKKDRQKQYKAAKEYIKNVWKKNLTSYKPTATYISKKIDKKRK